MMRKSVFIARRGGRCRSSCRSRCRRRAEALRRAGQGRGGGAPAAPTPRTAAPIDITGYWVAIISEDWRWRMITPARGDFPSIPMNAESQKLAEAWDPAKDEAAGEACRAYGAPGLMRGPTRLHITWMDDTTLKIESDYGMQTRLLKFGAPAPRRAPRSWQGVTSAQWVIAGGGRGRGAQRFGSMKSVTTNLRPGYLRKNGVPYSANTVFTEYWDLMKEDNGDQYLVDTNVVRRSDLPAGAVDDGHPLQEGSRRQQVRSDALRRQVLTKDCRSRFRVLGARFVFRFGSGFGVRGSSVRGSDRLAATLDVVRDRTPTVNREP